jgi:dephospho-CoA kinase
VIRVALSGGIGAGKTAAAEHFERLGALVISADRIGHDVIAPGGPAHDAVVARWPAAVRHGVVDRSTLAALVFPEPDELAALEAITHPEIRTVIARRVREAAAEAVVVEIPLLHHFLGDEWLRVVVDAPDDIRRARLRSRGMDGRDIAARMAAQPRRSEWLSHADHVIDNSGGRSQLQAEVDRVWELLTSV